MDKTASTSTFQVDLHGLVDLLSHHLYSSPRVYLRELLQNAVDAVSARRLADPDAPARITVRVSGAGLIVEDTGIGLTVQDVDTFLSTIGSSSKRADLGGLGDLDIAITRSEFIGQFGIGLLACFIVADELTVTSRSAAYPDQPPVRWRGMADGRYELELLEPGQMPEAGTRVELAPRRGAEEWLSASRVTELARHFGDQLPVPVEISDGVSLPTLINPRRPAWEEQHGSPAIRREALLSYGHQALGFRPLDVIELDVPLAGLRGAAYVLPTAVSPAQAGHHRVYVKGMLLTEEASRLLPEWAFFVRCVLNADGLRPTASREALYEDATLDVVREALGDRIRHWLAELASSRPSDLRAFLAAHQLAVKAMARFDSGLLKIMLPWLAFETTDGQVSLDEFVRSHRAIQVSRTVDEFYQVAAIASASGLAVVNGGYTYDLDLIRALPQIYADVSVSDLDTSTVLAHLDSADPGEELAAASFLGLARMTLDRLDCDVALRSFLPATVPALLLDDREARHERSRAHAEAAADELWRDILGALRSTAPRAQLVLNHANSLVRRVAAVTNPDLTATAVEALYGHALLMSRRPLRNSDSALLNRSFLGLLDHAVHSSPPEDQ